MRVVDEVKMTHSKKHKEVSQVTCDRKIDEFCKLERVSKVSAFESKQRGRISAGSESVSSTAIRAADNACGLYARVVAARWPSLPVAPR